LPAKEIEESICSSKYFVVTAEHPLRIFHNHLKLKEKPILQFLSILKLNSMYTIDHIKVNPTLDYNLSTIRKQRFGQKITFCVDADVGADVDATLRNKKKF
jgi:hypothetical protein